MTVGLTKEQRLLADKMLEAGVVRFTKPHSNAKNHYSRPVLNLRTPDHPTRPGPLTPEILGLIGKEFQQKFGDILWRFDRIAAIAGTETPLTDQLENVMGRNDLRLTLKKDLNGRFSGSVAGKYNPNEYALLIDDYLDDRGTFDAVRVLSSLGLRMYGIVVLIDYGQYDFDLLRRRHYNIMSIMTYSDMLRHYRSSGQITVEQFNSANFV